ILAFWSLSGVSRASPTCANCSSPSPFSLNSSSFRPCNFRRSNSLSPIHSVVRRRSNFITKLGFRQSWQSGTFGELKCNSVSRRVALAIVSFHYLQPFSSFSFLFARLEHKIGIEDTNPMNNKP
ncbi:hypothetical protein H5410_046861, partial [Solanum commersonii]